MFPWKPDFSKLIAELSRPCLPVSRGEQCLGTQSAFHSLIGKVTHALPGEDWPMRDEGRPIQPLAQRDLQIWPGRPEILGDLEAITVFHELYASVGLRNGDGWVLRAYPDAAKLVPMPETHTAEGRIRAANLIWGPVQKDMPFPDDAPEEKHRLLAKYYRRFKDEGFCSAAVKLGGYPRITQHAIEFCDKVPNEEQIREFGVSFMDTRLPNSANPRFAFQVGSMHELDFYYMDMGILYFGRGTGIHSDEWFMEGAGA